MVKKCNCKKCIYCRQIVTGTSIYRVNCNKYGDDKFKPTYCDQYKTKKDLSVSELEEALSNVLAEKSEEYVRTIVEKSHRSLHDELFKINK